jgi:DNA-binding transcriptional LysR family regulator
MDKLRAITLFCRTVEAQSFAAAAHASNMVPSALSKAISALERDLGFKLMHRSTRKLALTEEGSAYYEHCRQLLHGLEEAEAEALKGRSSARGTLRVGVHPALRFVLFSQCGGLLDAHPGLKLETVITNTSGAVLDEGLDVVLHIGKLADSGLVSRHLGWTRPVVCASPAYLAARGEPRHPRELAQHRAAIYARRDEEPNTRWHFARGSERHVVDVPANFIARDGIGLVDTLIGGCCIGRPFDFAVRPHLASGALKALLTDWASERQAVYAVLPQSGRHTPAKVGAFLQFAQGILTG